MRRVADRNVILHWLRLIKFDWQLRANVLVRRLRGRASALDTRHRWIRVPPPMAGRKACIVACFSAHGALSRHTLHIARAWHEQGFVVTLAVASDHADAFDMPATAWPFLDGVLVRNNSGYDFGSWATTLRSRADLTEASLLALTNDSLYGPLEGLDRMLARVEASRADIVGAVDSLETRRHFQSFLVFYRPRALKSRVFRRFWAGIPGAGREDIIAEAEIPHMTRMLLSGLKVDALYPASAPHINPTLRDWRALVDAGFPFVKVHLLMANTHHANIDGWDQLMLDRGYDPSIVRDHMGDAYPGSAAAAAASGPMQKPRATPETRQDKAFPERSEF